MRIRPKPFEELSRNACRDDREQEKYAIGIYPRGVIREEASQVRGDSRWLAGQASPLMASDHFGASLSVVLRVHDERVRLSRKARRERQVIEAILDEDVAEALVEAS